MTHFWKSWPRLLTPQDGILERVTQSDPALELSDARDYIRVDAGVEDSLIESAVLAIQGQLEPPRGWLGRALTQATYRFTIPAFADEIRLPAPPFVSLDKFEYLDRDGVRQTVDATLYRVIDTDPAYISRARDKEWPTDVDYTQRDAITIEYTAGYGVVANIPEPIKQFMRYQVAQIYDIRQPVVVGTTVSETPFVRHMLESWRA